MFARSPGTAFLLPPPPAPPSPNNEMIWLLIDSSTLFRRDNKLVPMRMNVRRERMEREERDF
jgi:hypothetical protein